jgi:integrase
VVFVIITEVERGRLHIPPGSDLIVFLLSDGEANDRPAFESPTSLKGLFKFKQYKGLPDGIKEQNTRATESIHIKHLMRILGAQTLLASITAKTLQGYVDTRCQEAGQKGKPISDATVRKEIRTLSSIWNRWALPRGLVFAPAPTKGLIYRKAKAKPPFQTWDQIERQVKRGGLSESQVSALWGSLFLTLSEIDDLLAFVRANTAHQWVHPMFVFAGHTGARRSEIIRSEIDDFDFATDMVTIREKKKDRSKEFTFRHVPMSPVLRKTMAAWFAQRRQTPTRRTHRAMFSRRGVSRSMRLHRKSSPFVRHRECLAGCSDKKQQAEDEQRNAEPGLHGPCIRTSKQTSRDD